MVVASIRLPSSLNSLASHRSQFSWRWCCRWRTSFISFPTIAPALSPIHSRLYSSSANGDAGVQLPADQTEIIFLGTGTSEGVPRVSCLTNPLDKCPVCSKATEPGNKNRRRNTSILIRHPSSSGTHNILIDAGKFFYHSALRWFPAFGIRTIDAVIITHSHADAIGGLDDLRDWTNNVQPNIPIYVAKRDFEKQVMKKTHYYLVDTSVILPGAAVSELQFNIISEEPFFVHGLKVNTINHFKSLKCGVLSTFSLFTNLSSHLLLNQLISDHVVVLGMGLGSCFSCFIIVLQLSPLPVWHGHGYRSLGFRFGNICYISDVSEIPEETYPLLKDCEILILDALRPDRSTSTHFGLPRALEEVRKIQPKRTLFTGMMHLMDHEEVNGYLAKLLESEGLDAQLSYDGLRIPVRL